MLRQPKPKMAFRGFAVNCDLRFSFVRSIGNEATSINGIGEIRQCQYQWSRRCGEDLTFPNIVIFYDRAMDWLVLRDVTMN